MQSKSISEPKRIILIDTPPFFSPPQADKINEETPSKTAMGQEK
jgi:hypothetical protein